MPRSVRRARARGMEDAQDGRSGSSSRRAAQDTATAAFLGQTGARGCVRPFPQPIFARDPAYPPNRVRPAGSPRALRAADRDVLVRGVALDG